MTARHEMGLPGTQSPRAGTAIDTVCGMEVNPSTARERVEHEGQTYFFCASGCAARFRDNPARYLAPPRTEAAAAGAPTTYTCPMHPEIVQEGPGACPICGMALEPKMPATAEQNPELRDMTRRFWANAAPALPVLLPPMSDMSPGLSPGGIRRPPPPRPPVDRPGEVGGAALRGAGMALVVRLRARSSSTWPSKTSAVMAAAASK